MLRESSYHGHTFSARPGRSITSSGDCYERPFRRTGSEHFGLLESVERLFGPELDGTHADKTDLLKFALDEIGADPAKCIMLGDRQMDIFAAKNNDIPNIGALWGYADHGELHMAEADMLAGTPEEVPEIAYDLLGLEV